MKNKAKVLSIFMIFCFVSPVIAFAQSVDSKMTQEKRAFWYSRVAKDAEPLPKLTTLDEHNQENILEGINILLSFRGDQKRAKFCGATRMDVNTPDKPCTVELAALFYISYLYYEKWDHAYGVALLDKAGNMNTPEILSKAYCYYQEWFDEVKKVGIVKARELHIEPLRGKDITWF